MNNHTNTDKHYFYPNRFKGQVAIVTGGASGLGRAITHEFCKEGGQVLFTDIDDIGELLQKEDQKKGHRSIFLKGDMGSERFCQKCVTETYNRFGRIDFLINNAFSFTASGINAKTEDWMRSFTVGPLAYARMVQAVHPFIKKSGGGAIVNISSISAHIAQKDRWTYNTSKGAVSQLTKCQALDLADDNIRVNSIDPGWIWTKETDKAADLDGGGRKKWDPIWGRFHMLKRIGKATEVARPVLFLLSKDASFITGTNLVVDGGYLSMGPEGLGENTINAGSK